MISAIHWAMFREALAAVLAFAAMVFALHLCTGCKPPDPKDILTVENAAAVAQYDAALVDCKNRAKEAQSFELYEVCEETVTKHFCRESAALRKEWERCGVLLPPQVKP